MSLNDIWPAPGRPDHPDFWDLSEIILQFTGAIEAQQARSPEEQIKVWKEEVEKVVDSDSLLYMALQRALRAVGAETGLDMLVMREQLVQFIQLYCDAFILGYKYWEKKKGKEGN